MTLMHRFAVALALLCLASTAARADSIVAMNGSYQKVGSAGSSVDIQNTSSGAIQLLTAAAQPGASAAGQVLVGGDHRCWTLTADLYALGAAPNQVAVTTGLSCGGGGGGGGGGGASTIANGADASEGSTTDQPLSSPTATGTIQSVLRALLSAEQSLVTSTQNPTGSSINTNQVSVGTAATQIVAARAGRNGVTVTNHGTTDVFLGGSGVTASTGTLLAGTKGASVTLALSGALYGVTGSGTQTVSFEETY